MPQLCVILTWADVSTYQENRYILNVLNWRWSTFVVRKYQLLRFLMIKLLFTAETPGNRKGLRNWTRMALFSWPVTHVHRWNVKHSASPDCNTMDQHQQEADHSWDGVLGSVCCRRSHCSFAVTFSCARSTNWRIDLDLWGVIENCG